MEYDIPESIAELLEEFRHVDRKDMASLIARTPPDFVPVLRQGYYFNLAADSYNFEDLSRFSDFVEHTPEDWITPSRLEEWLLLGALAAINSDNPSVERYRTIIDRFSARFVDPWLAQNPRRPPRKRQSGRPRVMFFGESLRQHLIYQQAIRATAWQIDRSRFEVFGGVLGSSDLPPSARDGFDKFFVFGSEAAALAEIRALSIDVLIYFDGVGDRMPWQLLAGRPARYQVFAGHLFTIGGDIIDAFFGDTYIIPQSKRHLYHAPIIALNQHWQIFTSGNTKIVPETPPAETFGYLTIGCFGRPSKCNEACFAAWTAILHRLPDARFLWINQSFRHEQQKTAVLEKFLAVGISAQRLEIGYIPDPDAFLASFSRVDFTVETFPFSGGLTTHSALSSGLPTVAMAGTDFVERIASAMMRLVGLEDLIADDLDQYVANAVGLAQDLNRLTTLRRELPARVASAPFTDPAVYARNFSDAIDAVLRMPARLVV